MPTEFVVISFKKSDACKTLKINLSGDASNITNYYSIKQQANT